MGTQECRRVQKRRVLGPLDWATGDCDLRLTTKLEFSTRTEHRFITDPFSSLPSQVSKMFSMYMAVSATNEFH